MVDKELIENWRNMLKPSISSWLFKTNYDGMGEQDKEEFGRDFDEILDLALIGLKYKAQLSQERTDKRTETHACDLIDRQAAIDAIEQLVIPEDMCVFEILSHIELAIGTLPSTQPERTCVNCGRTANNGGWYADGRTRCPIEEHYALPKDGYCHLWEKRNVTDDDYPERREE